MKNFLIMSFSISQMDSMMAKLKEELAGISKGSERVSQMIGKALSDLVHLQNISVDKDSKRAFLRRGIEKSVVLNIDKNVQDITRRLLSNPNHDKNLILTFQQDVYSNLMKIEMDGLGREITRINSLAAKRRTFLRSICDDDLFKICNDFLTSAKARESTRVNQENELAWKNAIADKSKQDSSIEKWLKVMSEINAHDNVDPECVNLKAMRLSYSQVMRVDVHPINSLARGGVSGDGMTPLSVSNIIRCDIAPVSNYADSDELLIDMTLDNEEMRKFINGSKASSTCSKLDGVPLGVNDNKTNPALPHEIDAPLNQPDFIAKQSYVGPIFSERVANRQQGVPKNEDRRAFRSIDNFRGRNHNHNRKRKFRRNFFHDRKDVNGFMNDGKMLRMNDENGYKRL